MGHPSSAISTFGPQKVRQLTMHRSTAHQPLDILSVPIEIAERILSCCHPCDVVAFSRVCRSAYLLVHQPSDQFLWRQLFLLHPFDDPRNADHGPNRQIDHECYFDWKTHLMRRMKAERLALRTSGPLSDKAIAVETFISVVRNAPPQSRTGDQTQPSHDLEWVERVLRQSRILDIDSLQEVQAFSQLRSYVALTLHEPHTHDIGIKALLDQRRRRSRGFVYDLRNYRFENKWGPHLEDGRINWVHIESLVNVILMNLRELPGIWFTVTPPLGLHATRACSAPAALSSTHDWAGVEGTWRRYVCFMDYRDLFAFNYSDPPHSSQNLAFFEDPRFREATRLTEIKLRIVSRRSLRHRHPLDMMILKGQDKINDIYPPTFFSGSSRGVNGNQAVVEGAVWMGHDDVVRWQFVTVYDGDTQWSSDGVQIGNAASASGVVGVWTTTQHEPGDPSGPFWLWKVEHNFPARFMEFTT